MIADWFAFIITIGEETVSWLSSMELFGAPLAGIFVGFFIVGLLFRVFLYKP